MSNNKGNNKKSKAAGIRQRAANLKQAWVEGRQFFREEFWDMDLSTLPRVKKAAITFIRVLAIVVKGLIADRCTLQASALTYYSLMALVPVLAMMLAVAKGLGAQEALMDHIGLARVESAMVEEAGEIGRYTIIEDSQLAELPEQTAEMITRAANVILTSVEGANFGTIGGIGVAILLWSVIKVMGKIENSFNDIWGIKGPRTWVRKFSDYISVMFLVPILVLAATSINALLRSDQVVGILQNRIGPLYYIYESIIGFSGIALLFIAFMCLYMFMPNTRVRFFPALVGGIVGGGIWFLWQGLYLFAQVGMAKTNAIYGTFAAIPLFLFWVYFGWIIVLFGAEVAFAVQNYKTYIQEQAAKDATFATLQMLGIIVLFEVCRDYYKGVKNWNPHEFSRNNGIPVRLIQRVLSILTEAGILTQAVGYDRRYVPGRDLGKITLADAEQALIGDISPSVMKAIAREHQSLQEKFKGHFDQFTQSLASSNLRTLVIEAEEG